MTAGVLATLLASAHAANQSTAAAERDVRVPQAWIRWLPANLPAGGYLTLINDGNRPVSLVSVASPTYAQVQLHRTLQDAGTSRMVAVASITVAAHSSLDFASLGYHLMLEQPRSQIAPGQTLTLILQFADGGTLTVAAPVRAPDGAPATGAGSNGHATSAGMPGMPGMPDMPGMPGMSK